jgi:hypothetical protein
VGKFKQETPSGDLVLAKWQPTSDAAQKISVKFPRAFEEPVTIQKLTLPAMYELGDETGNLRGLFNLRHLELHVKDGDCKNIIDLFD